MSSDFDVIPGRREMVNAKSKRGLCLPLLPRHHAYLTVDGGDGPRFARMFRETWKRMPLWERRRLLAYWKTGLRSFGIVLSPNVELAPFRLGLPRTFAMADHYGHRYRFRAKFVDRMPENVAQDLIAHELAHGIQSANGIRCVRQFADGRAHFVCQDGSDFGGFPEIEEDADCTMVRWGFDPGSVDRWGLDTGIIKTIDVPDSRTGMAVVSRRWDRTGK